MKRFLAALLMISALSVNSAFADKRPIAAPFEARSLSGDKVSLEALRGKVVVVVFWATWCAPCKSAMKTFLALQKEVGASELEVVAVSLDDAQTAAEVRGVARRYGWKCPVLLDSDGRIAQAYNPHSLTPFMVVIDREGRVAHQSDGFNLGDEAHWNELLKSILNDSSKKETVEDSAKVEVEAPAAVEDDAKSEVEAPAPVEDDAKGEAEAPAPVEIPTKSEEK